jgi:hypothetical protein
MLMIGALVALAQTSSATSLAVERERSRDACVAVVVTSPQQPPSGRPRGPFAASRILDVEFDTQLRQHATGPHLLELKVFTPRGHLYQTLAVPFTAPRLGRGTRVVDGYPRPVPEQETRAVLRDGLRNYEVSAVLPVGGTAITTNSLYGAWRVQPILDGQACGPTASFQIAP